MGREVAPLTDEPKEDEHAGKKRAVIGGLWIAASQLIPLMGTAVLSIVMGRVLGPDQLGLQSFIAYVEALLGALLLNVVTVMSIRLLSEAVGAQDEDRFRHLSRVTYLANVAAGAVSAVVLSVVGLFSATPTPWFVVAVSALVNGLGWGYGAIAIADRGWRPVASRRLITQLIAVILGIVAIFAGFGITGVFVANVIAALIVLVMLRRLVGPIPRASLRPLPHGLAHIWLQLLIMEGLVQIVQRRMEFLFLQAYSTEAQLAMYSIGFMVISTAAVIPQSLMVAGLPGIAESFGAGTIDRTASKLGSALRIVSIASLPLTAGVVCLGPAMVIVLYGPDYTQAAELVPIMSLSLLFVTGGNLCATFWTGANRLRRPIIGASAGAVVDIALAFLLIPQHGAWGAAIANLCGQTVMAVVMLYLTWRAVNRFPWMIGRWLGVLLYSAAVCAVVLVIVNAIGTSSEGEALVSLVAGGLAFLIAMLALGGSLGFVHGTDAEWLHTALPGPLRRLSWLFTGWKTRSHALST